MRVIAASVLAVAVGWSLVTGWGGVVHGHPAYAVVLGLTVVVAVLFARGRPAPGRWRRLRYPLAGLGAALLLATTLYCRPLTATSVATGAMGGSSAVTVDEGVTSIVIRPREADPAAVGLAFHPGALVDPRAYVPLLSRVAEAGHPVVVVKAPLGVPLLSPSGVGAARDAVPGTERWAVGGHSLGGAASSREVGDASGPVAVVFWASYPIASVAGSGLPVLSVSGTRDGLTTPEDVEASRADLPPDTVFVAVEGANHAMFGDYGDQRGDGPLEVEREAGQAQVVAETARFLDSLDG